MNEMIKINGNLPAHLQGMKVENVFQAAASEGDFPVISLKGKNFTIVRNGDQEIITDEHGDPVRSFEAVIVSLNPRKSKVFYTAEYTDGDSSAPACYSHDGLTPAADAETPQCKTCAACPKNIWGSAIKNGQKRKACDDNMRLAVAAAEQIDDPMLVRVPPGSLKNISEYGSWLAKHNIGPSGVVTRIGFDKNAAFAVTFKFSRFTEESEYDEVKKVLESRKTLVEKITGVSGGKSTTEERVSNDPVPAPAPVKKSPKLQEAEEEVVSVPKAAVQVDEPAPAPKVETKSVDDYNDIDAALENLNFDD
jgi:hypothetical protein